MNQRRAERALSDYLERLLHEPDADPRPHAEPEPAEPAPALLPAARNRLQYLLDQVSEKTQTEPATAVSTAVAPVAEIRTTKVVPAVVPAAEPIPHPVSTVSQAVAAAVLYSNSQYRSELPAQFPTLVFRIDELKLALPLHLLGGIMRRDKPLTPLVGRPDWFLGLMVHEPANINVVDTGLYILGDKYRPELVDSYRYVIRIGDTAWGLACTDLCATRGLNQDEVSWYDSNPRRPWLAGIIKDDRCALLNAQALVDSLAQFSRDAA